MCYNNYCCLFFHTTCGVSACSGSAEVGRDTFRQGEGETSEIDVNGRQREGGRETGLRRTAVTRPGAHDGGKEKKCGKQQSIHNLIFRIRQLGLQ